MVEVLPTLLDIAVREAVERILNKIKEGKKLSDSEATLLLVGELAKRITTLEKRVKEVRTDLNERIKALERRVEEAKESLEKRIEDSRDTMATRITALENRIEVLEKRIEGLEKRVEGLESEVKGLRSETYLIRSDVIMLLKSWLEEKKRGKETTDISSPHHH